MPFAIPLSIQQLYDDNRESLQLGWFAGFPGGERLISGDASSAADQVGHLNLIHPGRIQIFGHQEIEYYQRLRSEEHTSELQSLMRISYAVFCLKKKKNKYRVIFSLTNQ